MSWYSPDGLFLKFGTERSTVKKAGEFRNDGPFHVVEWVIPDLTVLTTTGAILTSGSDTVMLESGMRIHNVRVITQTAATSGGSATLDLGLIREDRTTSYDDDGLVAAAAITSHDAAGETVEYKVGVTGVGALVGTTLANDGLLIASYNTAAYTAGALIIQIEYFKPY